MLLAGAFFLLRGNSDKKASEEPEEKKRITEPVNIIEVTDRPFVLIEPIDSRNLSIEVVELKKPADELEYELEYQAGSLLQGAFGLLDLADLPTVEKILLGSCSAGGACTYHEDVVGGTLLGRFAGEDSYALKADWKYIENSGETEFSSKDAKFQIESDDLKRQSIIIIFNGFGYPEGLPGVAASDPYALTATGELDGEATLTMRANSDTANTIVGYDGSEWVEFETQKDGKMLTAEVELMELYLAVEK